MKTTKQFRVLMLPTEKVALIESCNNKLKLNIDRLKNNEHFTNQHLYIISDEEIKEGDWFINAFNEVYQLKKDFYPLTINGIKYKKIVATTDNSLSPKIHKGENIDESYPKEFRDSILPFIPESFVLAYIKAYNNSSPITEVQLEMEHYNKPENGFSSIHRDYKIKTRPDNTVIIHQNKMYSRDEVEKLCKNAWLFSDADSIIQNCCGQVDTAEPLIEKSFNEWKDKNL